MERHVIQVEGIVQGVGFRPFVYGLARRLGLRGFVQNRTGRVWIEIEGDARELEGFHDELVRQPPPLARIERVTRRQCAVRGDTDFHIEDSTADTGGTVFISPDVATCAACLAELFDPSDRRYLYPFLNCTNCGPRLTIVTDAPYDRQRTTMASFPMCSRCRAEYDDPTNRRFHAQPVACPDCGPQLSLLDEHGQRIAEGEPLVCFAAAIRDGRIGAIKGLGGFHLACDASSENAVATLRRRKHRDEKPFAVMVRDTAEAEALCGVTPIEKELLESVRRPIVLLRQRSVCAVAENVAPGNPYLGILLPYTPLHHLLLRELAGMPLVMTSGNRSDEPITYRDEAPAKLAGIADLYLTHDRPIQVRCDDSVTRVVDGFELPIRRSRGYAPAPIELPLDGSRQLLAVGGQLKATFALATKRLAFLSHHLGDLDYFEAYQAFEHDIVLYEKLFAIRPEWLVHDMHPDYASTRYARARAAREGMQLLAVQHHHAHMASCMAENGLFEDVIGISFDGTGFGPDGTIWGGEFLVGNYGHYSRAAHLRSVPMPGGDQAIREPWRMAFSHLRDASSEFTPLLARVLPSEMRALERMIERRINAPLTSSMGRLFDAVAALAGVRDRVTYEGQAAIELERLANDAPRNGAYPFAIDGPAAADQADQSAVDGLVVDTRPLISSVAGEVSQNVPRAVIARRFHSTLVEIVAAVCAQVRKQTGIEAVTLSGGVFLNALLTTEVTARLSRDGFRVYRHRLVPPNDGGLSLGQLAVAAARLSNSSLSRGDGNVLGDSREGGVDLSRA